MPLYGAAFSVYCNSGKIADVLVRPRELIKKGGLAAVLVSGKGESENLAVGKGSFVRFNVIFALFAKSRVAA